MSLCRDATLVKHQPNVARLSILKCRSWSCERCFPDRCKDLRGLARRGHPNRFLTLTIRRTADRSPAQAAVALAHAFAMLRQAIRRIYGMPKIEFLAVFEAHRSGYPHLHVLLRCPYIDVHVIRGFMTKALGSPMVWIEQITDETKAARYVAKYVGKMPTRFEGAKRYWRSQDWELPSEKYVPPEDDGTVWWSTSTSRPDTLIRIAISDGFHVAHDGDFWLIYGGYRPP